MDPSSWSLTSARTIRSWRSPFAAAGPESIPSATIPSPRALHRGGLRSTPPGRGRRPVRDCRAMVPDVSRWRQQCTARGRSRRTRCPAARNSFVPTHRARLLHRPSRHGIHAGRGCARWRALGSRPVASEGPLPSYRITGAAPGLVRKPSSARMVRRRTSQARLLNASAYSTASTDAAPTDEHDVTDATDDDEDDAGPLHGISVGGGSGFLNFEHRKSGGSKRYSVIGMQLPPSSFSMTRSVSAAAPSADAIGTLAEGSSDRAAESRMGRSASLGAARSEDATEEDGHRPSSESPAVVTLSTLRKHTLDVLSMLQDLQDRHAEKQPEHQEARNAVAQEQESMIGHPSVTITGVPSKDARQDERTSSPWLASSDRRLSVALSDLSLSAASEDAMLDSVAVDRDALRQDARAIELWLAAAQTLLQLTDTAVATWRREGRINSGTAVDKSLTSKVKTSPARLRAT